MGPGELTRAAEVIAKGLTDMRGTTAPRLHLELMCARVLLPGADVDGRGIHARLDRLERRLQMAAGDRLARAAPERADAAGPDPGTARPAPVAAPAPAPRPSSRPRADRQPAPGLRGRVRAGPAPRAAGSPSPAPPSSRARPRVRAGQRGRRRPGRPGGHHRPAIRNQWPDVLEKIKGRRRVTWITVRENAVVHDFSGGVLTLAFNNPGARESFSRGGSDQVVREAVLEVLDVAPTIQTVAGDEPPAAEPGLRHRADPRAERGSRAAAEHAGAARRGGVAARWCARQHPPRRAGGRGRGGGGVARRHRPRRRHERRRTAHPTPRCGVPRRGGARVRAPGGDRAGPSARRDPRAQVTAEPDAGTIGSASRERAGVRRRPGAAGCPPR